MINLGPTNYEIKFGMYPMQNKLVGSINKLAWLIWLSVKLKWPIWFIVNHNGPLNMVNLTKLRSSWWTFGLFDQMFGLSHGQKCHFNEMFKSKITRFFHTLGL
jgi:hypothetical protein